MNEVGDTGFAFSDLVEEAVARSGGQSATASDVLNVRRSLRLLTERWAAEGFNTWRIKTTEVFATGTVTAIKLPSCVDDVIEVKAKRSDVGSETIMRRLSASEYASLSNRDTYGQPSQYWLQRTDPPMLNIYPIGLQTQSTSIVVFYVERPESFDRYFDEDSVPGRWLHAMVHGVAHDLARKRPLPDGGYDEALIDRLGVEAEQAFDIAQRADRDRKNYRYNVYGRA